MRLKLNTGICPILNVGMYETLLDPRYMFDWCDDEIEIAGNLTEEEKEYYFDTLSYKFDNKKYGRLIAKYATEILQSVFNNIADKIKVELNADACINSPEFYNYRNDELDFEIKIDEIELDKILNVVIDNAHFFKWAEKYKSRSGFISCMPHAKEDYIDAINGEGIERAVAMYIEYVVAEGFGFEEDIEFGYDYDLYEQVSSNGVVKIVSDIIYASVILSKHSC